MTTKEKIAVMQAWLDGKPIQIANKIHEDWQDMHVIGEPVWNWELLKYRIKPEQKLRPYKNAEEFLQAQNEHGKYVILANIKDTTFMFPKAVTNESITLDDTEYLYKECLNNLIWQDKHPCGIIEE